MTEDRPKGGRRSQDYPEAVARDMRVLTYLKDNARSHYSIRESATRNTIAADLEEADPRKVTYALHRLRRRGLVRHVAKGNEGHGYWEAIIDRSEA